MQFYDDSTDLPKRGSRRIVGVKNNYTTNDITTMCQFFKSEKVHYYVYGLEEGEQHTPHIQFYFEVNDAMSYSAIQKKLGFSCWLKAAKGHGRDAAGYCKKGALHSSPWKKKNGKDDWSYYFDNPSESWLGGEDGELSMQGKRTDIDAPVEAIRFDSATLSTIAHDFPIQYVKYYKGFQSLRSHMLLPRKLESMPEVIWLHGPTGTGKTHDAYHKYWPDIPHYHWKPSNGNWWDGYDGQDKIILDEFRAQMTWSDILGLLDRYECRVPIKGGFTQIQASKFVITSPHKPEHTYKEDDRYDRIAQLLRRITEVKDYKGITRWLDKKKI